MTYDIGGKPHILVDFKTQFTLKQLGKTTALLSKILDKDALGFITGKITNEDIPALIEKITSVTNNEDLRQLLCVFFLPEGEKYTEPTAERLASMDDAPIGPLVEAVKGFFGGKSDANANTLSSSTEA